MEIGRKIYYQKATGNVLLDTGEHSGAVIGTTIEQDFQLYSALNGLNPDAIGCLQLDYGQLSDNFEGCYGYQIDITKNPIDATAIIFNLTPPEASLDQVKAAKGIEMSAAKDAAIQAGFDYNGKHYVVTPEADNLFTQQCTNLLLNPSLTTVNWIFPNLGKVVLQKDEFLGAVNTLAAFKESQYDHYMEKVAEYSSKTTVEDVLAVTW